MKRVLKTHRQCPVCASTWVRGSGAFNWRERVLYPKIGLRPYRCEKCGYRFTGLKRQQRIDTRQD